MMPRAVVITLNKAMASQKVRFGEEESGSNDLSRKTSPSLKSKTRCMLLWDLGRQVLPDLFCSDRNYVFSF